MKILYVVNEARFFHSHRLALGLHALEQGFEVVVAFAPDTGEDKLEGYGFRLIPFVMSRSGFKPQQEYKTYQALKLIYLHERPDIIHHVTIKPVLYGSFAAQRAKSPAVVNAIPGMGFLYTQRGIRAALLRVGVNFLYRLAFRIKNMRVIFQNSEDQIEAVKHAVVAREKTVLIRGSGVDLTEFYPAAGSEDSDDYEDDKQGVRPRHQELQDEGPGSAGTRAITYMLVARMLRDKGVVEFAQAAAQVKKIHPDWRFLLVGAEDEGNPTTLSQQDLLDLEQNYGVEWLGPSDRVAELMRSAHVVCLPTYREGLPKTLLEASAAGLGIIASDIAGCREVVTDGVTGLLVPPRQVKELSQAMLYIGENPGLRKRLGYAAQQKAQMVFSVEEVVDHTFRVYELLLNHD